VAAIGESSKKGFFRDLNKPVRIARSSAVSIVSKNFRRDHARSSDGAVLNSYWRYNDCDDRANGSKTPSRRARDLR
jgi:hypothetical protein